MTSEEKRLPIPEHTDLPADDPPPYSVSSASASSSSGHIPPLPHQNHLHMNSGDTPLSGAYVLDVSLATPPGTEAVGKELSVWAENAPVDVWVYLVGAKENGKVELEVGSKNGPVKFVVAERPLTMPIRISITAHNGPIAVLLPHSYKGSLFMTYKNGDLKVRPSLASFTRTIMQGDHEFRCWVREFDDESGAFHGRAAAGPSRGDECEIVALNGNVEVGFYDEKERAHALGEGFFLNRLLHHHSQHH